MCVLSFVIDDIEIILLKDHVEVLFKAQYIVYSYSKRFKTKIPSFKEYSNLERR